MKRVTLILFFIFLTVFSFAQKQKIKALADGICVTPEWKLVFEDNFDGENLNLNLWKNREYSQGSLSGENNEEYMTLDNVKVENGVCKLIPKKETVLRKAVSWKPDSLILEDGKINIRTYQYTSSWIETKQEFLYGKYEIRCKIPKGKSFWPAFWMYGEVNKVDSEIDVFEFWNPQNSFGKYSPKKLSMQHHMSIHHNHKMSAENYTGPDYSLVFHTFTVVWDSTKIEWYVDGSLKRRCTQYQTRRGKNIECNDLKANHNYFLNPAFPKTQVCIIASIGLQNGDNGPDENTFKNPAFEIDYIRYYNAVEK